MCVCHKTGKAISPPKGMVPSVLWPPCCLAITVQLLMYLFVTQTDQDQVPSLGEDSFTIWNASHPACTELSDANMWEHFILQSSGKPFVSFTDSQKTMWFYWSVIISILVFILFLLIVHLTDFSPFFFTCSTSEKYTLKQCVKEAVLQSSIAPVLQQSRLDYPRKLIQGLSNLNLSILENQSDTQSYLLGVLCL